MADSYNPCGICTQNEVKFFLHRLKATNEQQDNGAGILNQVAQFPIDQVYFIYARRPCLSLPMQDQERQGIGC